MSSAEKTERSGELAPTEESLRIVVIGGGPGGLHAAISAARRGMRVSLFEKRAIGEGIVCGECIFDSLGLLEKPTAGLLYPVKEILFEARGKHTLAIADYRNLWMMDRPIWQRHLAAEAAKLGVLIKTGEKITPGNYKDYLNNYDWIIDASGTPSLTSRRLGFAAEYFRNCLLAYQYVIQGDFSTWHRTVKVGFLSSVPSENLPGYFWIFPRNRCTANVGVVYAGATDSPFSIKLKELLKEVMKREGLDQAVVLDRGGGVIPARILDRLVYDRILLVGDAAGLTSPLHGGGIDLACVSGVMAVEAICSGKQGVASYRDRLMALLRDKLFLERMIIAKMKSLPFEDFDDLIHAAAVKAPGIRTKIALRHPGLLVAAWRWLRTGRSRQHSGRYV